ncbi:hypothetical protein BD626DRAFT_254466, partial [Schizophyllum amplum]
LADVSLFPLCFPTIPLLALSPSQAAVTVSLLPYPLPTSSSNTCTTRCRTLSPSSALNSASSLSATSSPAMTTSPSCTPTATARRMRLSQTC